MRGREREILDAAKELIDETGVESLTMRKLGQHCQIAAAGIYYYFASREDLIARLHDELFQEFSAVLGETPATPDAASVARWLSNGRTWLQENTVLVSATCEYDQKGALLPLPLTFVETVLGVQMLQSEGPPVAEHLAGFANDFARQVLRVTAVEEEAVDMAKFLTGIRISFGALGFAGASDDGVISLTSGDRLHSA